MANRVVHFEIEAEDKERATKFYVQTFGWDMQQMGKDFSDYVVVVTGDTEKPGGINGGMYTMQGKEKEVNAYRCVISVDDVKKSMEDVKNHGGKIVHGPDDIAGVGTFASCIDTEGNYFSILQPSPMEKKK